MRMALVGRHERMTADRAHQLGMVSEVVEPDHLRGRRRRAGREDRPQLAGGHGRDQAGPVGRARAGPHRRLPGRLGPAGRLWGHPDQTEGPLAFTERRDTAVAGDLTDMTYDDPEGRAPRAGRLAHQRPARPAQRHEQRHARRVRRRLDRARRRSRRAGDRPHRRGPGLPDRRRRRRDRQRRRGHGALPGVARGVRPPLHRLAPGGVEAGHHRRQRHLRRRRVPLGRRRRHRDRRLRRPVLRPPRVGRPGGRHRGHRPAAQDAVRGGDAHGVRGPPRAHDGPAGLRAGHDQRGRRPARAAPGGGPGAGREGRPQLPGRHGRDQAGAVGRAGDGPHRRLPGRRRRAGVDVGPPRPERGAPRPSPRSGRRSGRCERPGRPARRRRRVRPRPPRRRGRPHPGSGPRTGRRSGRGAGRRRRRARSAGRGHAPGPGGGGHPLRCVAHRRRLRAAQPATGRIGPGPHPRHRRPRRHRHHRGPRRPLRRPAGGRARRGGARGPARHPRRGAAWTTTSPWSS